MLDPKNKEADKEVDPLAYQDEDDDDDDLLDEIEEDEEEEEIDLDAE